MRIFRITTVTAALYLLCLATLAVWTEFSPGRALLLALLGALAWIRPALGAALLFFVLPADVVRPLFGSLFVSYSEIAFGVTVVAWLAGRVARGRLGSLDWRVLLWGAPFVAAVLVSALLNNQWYRVAPHVFRSSELICACWLAANAWRAEGSRHAYRWAIGAAALFYSAVGLSQVTSAHNARIYSLLGNPNQFAAYLNLLLPFLLAMQLATPRGRLWLAILLTTVLAGVTAQSRAALLGGLVAVGLVVFGLRRKTAGVYLQRPLATVFGTLRRRWDTLALLLFYTAVALFFVDAMAPRLATRAVVWVHAYQERSSQAGMIRNLKVQRVPFYRIGFVILQEKPCFGIGPGNYERTIDQHWDLVAANHKNPFFGPFQVAIRSHLHDLALQLAVDYGLVGLAAFLYFLATVAFVLWKGRRKSIWCWAGVGVLIAFAIINLVDVTVYSLALETGFALGMALPGPRSAHRAGSPQPPVES